MPIAIIFKNPPQVLEGEHGADPGVLRPVTDVERAAKVDPAEPHAAHEQRGRDLGRPGYLKRRS